MLGMSESKIRNSINSGCFRTPYTYTNIQGQNALSPPDILQKIATSVAKTIIENNKCIERDLMNRGLIR